jgi:peptidoglycan/xylan/chitin deacetylase (PgdA/CDA1 family)
VLGDPIEPLGARRAARRAQLRRRRRLRVGGSLLLLIVAVVAVAALAQGGSRSAGGAAQTTAPTVTGGQSPVSRPPADSTAGIATVRRLLALGLPIYCAGRRGNDVAFTFDDGPGPYTYLAVRKLRAAHERATFFVVGRSMDHYPGWVRRELRLAVIGDHTYTHPFLPGLTASEATSQIERTKQKIEAVTGESVYLFRPPYGGRNTTIDQIAKRLGLLEIIWSVDSADSLGASWAGIIRNVEAGLHPGAIILMHENRGQTIRALTTILPYMQAHHFRSVSLQQLLGSDPPSDAQVRRGLAGCTGRSGSTHSGS